MKKTMVTLIGGALLSLAPLQFAVAHGNATGVVKERMDTMDDMKASMKTLAAIFSGEREYNAQQVKDAADTIAQLSGESLLKLFPKGSLKGLGHTEAKPEIWQEWPRFSGYAMDLQRFSEALSQAASKYEAGSQQAPATTMMSGSSSMMGGHKMMGMKQMSQEHLNNMPADHLFTMVKESCSNCHTRYRTEED